jgi:four helix bundle protein
MNNFRELLVWQKAVSLVVQVYSHTNNFPDKERFNLVSQMQRAATSIASNIAEGCGRNSNPLFKQFLTVALGSAYELETQLIISNKLSYLKDEDYSELSNKATEIQKMIFGLHGTL